jgi:hypothetical protein
MFVCRITPNLSPHPSPPSCDRDTRLHPLCNAFQLISAPLTQTRPQFPPGNFPFSAIPSSQLPCLQPLWRRLLKTTPLLSRPSSRVFLQSSPSLLARVPSCIVLPGIPQSPSPPKVRCHSSIYAVLLTHQRAVLGPYITLQDGKQIIDGVGGAAVSCIGNGHPAVVKAVQQQVEKMACKSTYPYKPPSEMNLAF